MEKFWIEKKEVWKLRCDIMINWEKEQGITKKQKRQRPHNSTKEKQASSQEISPFNPVKYLKNKFATLYIEATNSSFRNTLKNSFFLHNLFAFNISASGVLTR